LTRLELSQVVDAGFGPLSVPFEAGLWVMLGDSADSLGRVLEIAAGVRRARKGRALLDGDDVFESARARRKLASLLPVEGLLPASRVRESLELAAELRGASLNGAELLERAGLARFAASPPERLGLVESRAVALAFALAHAGPSALLLHDPLSLKALLPRELVLAACRAHSERACVLVSTTRLEDAIALGGTTCRLEQGRLVAHVGAAKGPAEAAVLVVRSPDAQRLSVLLAEHNAVHSVVYEEQRSPRELLVRGADLAMLSRSLCELAHTEHILIEALTPLVPPRLAGSP
jgi:ABC-type multidrug transport system ATPase subunit